MILKSKHFVKHGKYEDLRELENNRLIVTPLKEESAILIPSIPSKHNRYIKAGAVSYCPYSVQCSCSYSSEGRKLYCDREIHTVCAHLARYYKRMETTEDLNLPLLLIEKIIPGLIGPIYRCDSENMSCVFACGKDSQWLSVFLKQREWVEYGFNFIQKRWARGTSPPYREIIEQAIEDYFLVTIPSL